MTDIMSNTVQGSNILDVLKKKMRQTKEEMEKYKEDSEDMQKKLQVEIMRREEVSRSRKGQLSLFGWRSSNVQWHFLLACCSGFDFDYSMLDCLSQFERSDKHLMT